MRLFPFLLNCRHVYIGWHIRRQRIFEKDCTFGSSFVVNMLPLFGSRTFLRSRFELLLMEVFLPAYALRSAQLRSAAHTVDTAFRAPRHGNFLPDAAAQTIAFKNVAELADVLRDWMLNIICAVVNHSGWKYVKSGNNMTEIIEMKQSVLEMAKHDNSVLRENSARQRKRAVVWWHVK